MSQAEAGQVHRVFRQLFWKAVRVYMFQFGEPVQNTLELPKRVALRSEDLSEEDFGFDAGQDT